MAVPTRIRRWTRRAAYALSLISLGLALRGVWQMGIYGSWSTQQYRDITDDVYNSTLGFQKIFVVNLPDRTDRRDALSLAASVSNVSLDFVPGIKGIDVSEKGLPMSLRGTEDQDPENRVRKMALIGSWRAHINVLLDIVTQNMTTALIMEDDVDWDINIHPTLHSIALASRAWLSQSASSPISPSTPNIQTLKGGILDLPLSLLSPSLPPVSGDDSPYGQDWDLLHLGHCGSELPPPPAASEDDAQDRETEFAISFEDEAVPLKQHLRPHPFARLDAMGKTYPSHTRLVQRPRRALCTLAYAVSQRGARKLLYRMGVSGFGDDGKLSDAEMELKGASSGKNAANCKDAKPDVKECGYFKGRKSVGAWRPYDYAVRDWCDGYFSYTENRNGDMEAEKGGKEREGKTKRPLCLAPNPPVFSHHYADGGSSDITGIAGGYVTKTGTPYVRKSVRMNLGVLLGEEEGDVVDGWPDEGKGAW